MYRLFFKRFEQFVVSEDELVSLDELQEKLAGFEDYVQSTDVAAMQSVPSVSPAIPELTSDFRALDWTSVDGNDCIVSLVGKEVGQMMVVAVWREQYDVDTVNCDDGSVSGWLHRQCVFIARSWHAAVCTVT